MHSHNFVSPFLLPCSYFTALYQKTKMYLYLILIRIHLWQHGIEHKLIYLHLLAFTRSIRLWSVSTKHSQKFHIPQCCKMLCLVFFPFSSALLSFVQMSCMCFSILANICIFLCLHPLIYLTLSKIQCCENQTPSQMVSFCFLAMNLLP